MLVMLSLPLYSMPVVILCPAAIRRCLVARGGLEDLLHGGVEGKAVLLIA
jgi:hypothetical protein